MVLCLCFSVYGAMDAEVQRASDGAYMAFASAIASYYSDPRVGLQGVSFDDADGIVPDEISFVRSDISTYQSSFAFFSDDQRAGFVMDVIEEIMQGRSLPLSEGELIVDGTIRVTGKSGMDALTDGDDDWSGAELDFTASLALDGSSLAHGIIIEGVFHAAGMDGRTVAITTENFIADGREYRLSDAVFSF